MKKCPFCGGKARLLSWKKGKCRFVIGCSEVGCVMWLPDDVLWKSRNCYTSGAWANKQSLIDAWNRRAK